LAIAAVPVQVRPRVLIHNPDDFFYGILFFRFKINSTNAILHLHLQRRGEGAQGILKHMDNTYPSFNQRIDNMKPIVVVHVKNI
tara:strand:- start:149 stop:400 length:252 start_codon:yes stop_codon:yes gene_type:complete